MKNTIYDRDTVVEIAMIAQWIVKKSGDSSPWIRNDNEIVEDFYTERVTDCQMTKENFDIEKEFILLMLFELKDDINEARCNQRAI